MQEVEESGLAAGGVARARVCRRGSAAWKKALNALLEKTGVAMDAVATQISKYGLYSRV